jgi:hypothetical protein
MAKKGKKNKPSVRDEVMAYLDRNPDTQVPALVVLFNRPYGTMWSARNLWLEQRTDPNAPEQATLAWDEPDTSKASEPVISTAPRVKSKNYIPQEHKTPSLVTAQAHSTPLFVTGDVPCKKVSDGSTASYYELPEGAKELQDLISYKNMNAQIGEIFRACMRYGESSHSDELRDAKKIRFYINAEIKRLGG